MTRSMQGIPHSVISCNDKFKKRNNEKSIAKIADCTRTDLINGFLENNPELKDSFEQMRDVRGFSGKGKSVRRNSLRGIMSCHSQRKLSKMP